MLKVMDRLEKQRAGMDLLPKELEEAMVERKCGRVIAKESNG